jgi:hypothetical protein
MDGDRFPVVKDDIEMGHGPITVDGDRLLLVEDVSVWVLLPSVRDDNGCT